MGRMVALGVGEGELVAWAGCGAMGCNNSGGGEFKVAIVGLFRFC